MTLIGQALAVASKDIRVEVRGRHGMAAVLPFSATLLIAFGLSLGPGRALLLQAAPGLLWLAVLFAAVLAFRQAYHAEGEDGALEGLVLAPIDKAAVFLGKASAVAALLLVLEAVVVTLVAAMFGMHLGHAPAALAATFLLGTIGLAAVGSLFGVLVESARTRDVFPLLLLPLATPVLMAGAKATELVVGGRTSEVGSWLGLLGAFDVAVVGVGMLVFGHVVED
jgi:heme exporter protein B